LVVILILKLAKFKMAQYCLKPELTQYYHQQKDQLYPSPNR